MAILKFVFICLEVLMLFNVLIFVHELGHFWAARWRGLKAERFAIWFGKPIWSKTIGGVEYALGWIPCGGYVSLPQMAPMEMIEGKSEEGDAKPLPQISVADKIIVAFAGPLFSFLLAIVFAVLVWAIGRPVSESETTTTVGYVVKDGPADKAGLKAADKILEVDGHPVTKFGGMGSSITWRVVRSEGVTVPIKFERDGQIRTLDVTPVKPATKLFQRRALREIQIEPAQTPIVAFTFTNSPAYAAGLRRFDEVVEANGRKLVHYGQVAEIVGASGTNAVSLKVRRGDSEFTLSVTPEKPVTPPELKAMLGISWVSGGKMAMAHPSPLDQVSAGINAMGNTLGALFAKGSDIGVQHLSGAVKILNIYYLLFESEQGWRMALWFSVVMNVNLAILNMLPLPVLDGGHILLAVIEGIRRRPVSHAVLNFIQSGCAIALICFMVFVTFFDGQELFRSRTKDPEPQFSPKTLITPVLRN